MEQYEIINIPMLEPVRDIEMLSALSRCISVTYNGPDVTCDENIKRIEITALDKYMETGIRPDRQYKVNIETEGQKTEEETT